MFEDNRIKREIRRNQRRKNEKMKKLKLNTLSGTLIMSASIALQLFIANLVEPLDVRYYFTSDDVNVTQPGDNYTDKNYEVRNSNGKLVNFTFQELENIEPEVHSGYTSIPNEYLGVRREENNPIKRVIKGTALAAFMAGGIMTGTSVYRQNQMKEERRR